jgi:hypothetical protein
MGATNKKKSPQSGGQDPERPTHCLLDMSQVILSSRGKEQGRGKRVTVWWAFKFTYTNERERERES